MLNLEEFATLMAIHLLSSNHEERFKLLESVILQLQSKFDSFLASIEQSKQIDPLLQ